MNEFMEEALILAKKAAKQKEIPVGAVIVKDGKIISKARNMREKKKRAAAHAEMLAIDKACRRLKSWRLDGCDIYVTLEPCLMCLGAILNARIKNLYFGCSDDKRDKLTDFLKTSSNNGLNHNLEIHPGIGENECKAVLKEFFAAKRQKGSAR